MTLNDDSSELLCFVRIACTTGRQFAVSAVNYSQKYLLFKRKTGIACSKLFQACSVVILKCLLYTFNVASMLAQFFFVLPIF